MNRYWKAWLALAGCVPVICAAVVSGDGTAIAVACCGAVTAVGAVLFGPSNKTRG